MLSPRAAPIIATSRERFEDARAALEDLRTPRELPPYLVEPLQSLLIDLDVP